jgi:zinc transport system substrate-binding protein
MNKLNLTLVLGLALLVGCAEKKTSAPRGANPVVCTVNYPLAYFAERIAGGHIEVVFPAVEGDPAFWTPSTEMIITYQNAALILLNGAHYAKWIQHVSLPPAKLIDTSRAFHDQLIPIKGAVSHTHGAGEKHAHGKTAFTVWIDPQLAIQQAKVIRDAFSDHWSEHAATFNANFQTLRVELAALDADLTRAFAAYESKPIIGSHPVYQYLTRRYSLKMTSVHWEPDAMPNKTMQRELEALLEGFPAKTMLWEGVPEQDIRLLVDKKGLDTKVFDPCGNRPATGNYFTIMKQNLRRLERH